MTCKSIKSAFKDNAPDKYQKHFQVVQKIVHDRSTPDFIKYQQIRDLVLSAETGLLESVESIKNMEV